MFQKDVRQKFQREQNFQMKRIRNKKLVPDKKTWFLSSAKNDLIAETLNKSLLTFYMVSVKLVSNNNGGYLIRDDKMCDLYLHISPILYQQSVRYLLSSAILRVARKSCHVGHLFQLIICR